MTTARERLATSVIIGKDQFLFHRDHQTTEQLSGELRLTPDELSYWVGIIESRSKWCRNNGVVFRMLIVPEKHVVYSDKLPIDIQISESRPAIQILNALSTEVRAEVLYPLDLLRDNKDDYKTFFKTDTHWTELGAFLVYEQLLKSLPCNMKITPICAQNLNINEKNYIGDLGVRLEPEQNEKAMSLSHAILAPFKCVFENKLFTRGNTSIYESTRLDAPKLLLFRDSFFNYVIPHLIPIFSRTVAVSSINLHYDLIESEKPDIIIFEIIERYLGNLDNEGNRNFPNDNRDIPFEQLSGASLIELNNAGK